jgi:polyisoprenoid-binding protein YceI
MTEAHRRRWLLRTVVGVVIAVGVVVGGPWVYATFFLREAPEPLALAPTTTAAPSIPTGPVEIDGTWYVQEGSEAGYRLGETLSGEQVTVVGRTTMVSGAVIVDTDGVLTQASIVVDAGSITTDEAARDAFFRRALDTSTFPGATFELLEPVDVAGIGLSDEPLTITAAGTLSLHGVSAPATATLAVARTVDGVELAGQIPVTLADFDLTAPDLGWVVVDAAGTIEVHVLLGRAEPAADAG